MTSQRHSVTSEDVARHAGVSQSAVSLVISGKAGTRVSAATAARIRQSAAELGYSPNHAAMMLRTGSAPTLALAVPTVTQPFFSSVLVAAERRARAAGHSMILLDSGGDEQWVPRLSSMLRGGLLAGAIAFAPTAPEARVLADTGLPVVLADIELAGSTSIRFDFSDGARQAAAHLAELGHERIAYLAAAGSERETYRLRREAFSREVAERGGEIVAVEHSASLEFDDARAAATRLLAGGGGFTAVMCDDDLLAAAMVKAAGASRVPDSLSVIGVGDIELSRLLSPELTTIELSADAIGAGAVDLVLRGDDAADAVQLSIPSRLIVRGSTGRVRP